MFCPAEEPPSIQFPVLQATAVFVPLVWAGQSCFLWQLKVLKTKSYTFIIFSHYSFTKTVQSDSVCVCLCFQSICGILQDFTELRGTAWGVPRSPSGPEKFVHGSVCLPHWTNRKSCWEQTNNSHEICTVHLCSCIKDLFLFPIWVS